MKKFLAIGAAGLAMAASSPALAQSIAPEAFDLEETLTVASDVPGTIEAKPITAMAVEPHYRDISPFYGDIGAFYKDISPFYGNIGAFYGNISPFYGDIDAFWKDISPFYGDIGAFWGDIDAFWKDISPFDAANMQQLGDFGQAMSQDFVKANTLWQTAGATGGNLAALDNQLGLMYSRSQTQFGKAVTAKTGKTFYDGFYVSLFARHGLDPKDKTSLLKLNEGDRVRFFLDWHDTLMTYAGIDHVDHWMRTVNWTPLITQEQGSGKDTTIGIIDASVYNDASLNQNVMWSARSGTDLDGHGAGVASLLYGAHDGKGVMGIAPGVKVTTYNPFGADGTADWSDITAGISKLKAGNFTTWLNGGEASIINLSLGEKGWTLAPGFNDVFSNSSVSRYRYNTLYVIAAGNDGISQTQNINWNFSTDPGMIVVGSVGPSGKVSSFSNKPGTACLLDNGVCKAGNQLYMRTVMAPGEMLLMSDGNGGLVRRSGTSFAAPLVAGAVALMHDRWPWLAKYPKESAEIIFKSARDMGEPGPDPVYGWGVLDVAASQAPLNFNNLRYTKWDASGWWLTSSSMSSSQVLSGGIRTNWQSDKIFFSVLEPIGLTYRDFKIPMSTLLYGARTSAGGSDTQTLQSYLTSRFENWIRSGGQDSDGDGVAGLSEIRSNKAQLPGGWSVRYDAMAPMQSRTGSMDPRHAAATLTGPGGKVALTIGYGQGATTLNGARFGMANDSNPLSGGANPVLGFASGDSFAAASYKLGEATSVRFGFSDNRMKIDEIPGLTSLEEAALKGQDGHAAAAFTVDIDRKLAKNLSVNLQYTHLEEEQALLGTQSTVKDFMGRGTATDAFTLAASLDAGAGVTVDLSATAARSSVNRDQAFATPEGVLSTAAQATIGKRGVFQTNDALRFSLSQPLNVEKGTMQFRGIEVVDRQTGQLGEKVYEFAIDTKRQLVTEAIYAAPLGDDGEFGFFGRYETGNAVSETENYTLGGRFAVRF